MSPVAGANDFGDHIQLLSFPLPFTKKAFFINRNKENAVICFVEPGCLSWIPGLDFSIPDLDFPIPNPDP
jgi:hypothetical protein